MSLIIETFEDGFTVYVDEIEVGTVDQMFGARYCTEAAREIIEEIAEDFNINLVVREVEEGE